MHQYHAQSPLDSALLPADTLYDLPTRASDPEPLPVASLAPPRPQRQTLLPHAHVLAQLNASVPPPPLPPPHQSADLLVPLSTLQNAFAAPYEHTFAAPQPAPTPPPAQSFDSHTIDLALLGDERHEPVFSSEDLDASLLLASQLGQVPPAEKREPVSYRHVPELVEQHHDVRADDLDLASPHTTALSILDVDRCDFSKPINALGPLCFAGFYLVSLTRTIVRNSTVPRPVRHVFMAPQLHFEFTVRDKKDAKWRNIATSQIPYNSLSTAGDWLRAKLGINQQSFTFKNIKDALQKLLTDAVADARWDVLVAKLHADFADVSEQQLDEALACEAISGRAKCTTHQFFKQLNCHKGAPDIRRDVDGAISAREALKSVLQNLGLNSCGSNISVARFRDQIHPMWRLRCQYVREHERAGCCQFSDGGYFKKIMVHRHLYSATAAASPYHVKDLFEGLEEVIKLWNNPTGMCVREAKCAAGLKYNVDKSFQSGIRSYSKVKFLETAPHTAQAFIELERELNKQACAMLHMKHKSLPRCRRALRQLEIRHGSLSQRQLPDLLQPKLFDLTSRHVQSISRKRTRQERDAMSYTATPREQKRQHAHRTLERKKATEDSVKKHLEQLREDCQRQQNLLDSVKSHGVSCGCHSVAMGDVNAESVYVTSANARAA